MKKLLRGFCSHSFAHVCLIFHSQELFQIEAVFQVNTASASGPGNGNLGGLALGWLLSLKTRGASQGKKGLSTLIYSGHIPNNHG
jgi:hypothetical protein